MGIAKLQNINGPETDFCSTIAWAKAERVFKNYKDYLTALPGTTSAGVGLVSPTPLAYMKTPGILIKAKTEKDAKLLKNLLTKELEGILLRVEITPASRT